MLLKGKIGNLKFDTFKNKVKVTLIPFIMFLPMIIIHYNDIILLLILGLGKANLYKEY